MRISVAGDDQSRVPVVGSYRGGLADRRSPFEVVRRRLRMVAGNFRVLVMAQSDARAGNLASSPLEPRYEQSSSDAWRAGSRNAHLTIASRYLAGVIAARRICSKYPSDNTANEEQCCGHRDIKGERKKQVKQGSFSRPE